MTFLGETNLAITLADSGIGTTMSEFLRGRGITMRPGTTRSIGAPAAGCGTPMAELCNIGLRRGYLISDKICAVNMRTDDEQYIG
mmetsp:Transcript_103023/g.330448  ORF Transcript_103023/g.330448 Transcript_103023/m.330448 type:complete len:85 (+) Transcript_103023:256-510(+)